MREGDSLGEGEGWGGGDGEDQGTRVPILPRSSWLTTLRTKLQPVFHCSSLSTLDPGSGREIPAICHGTGVWHGYFTPES